MYKCQNLKTIISRPEVDRAQLSQLAQLRKRVYSPNLQKRNLLWLFFNVGGWKTDWAAFII